MSKAVKSKLDPHAERLEEWFAAGKTLAEAQAELKADGLSVSLSRLSDWWAERQSTRLQERLLGQIASGARQVKEVNSAFAANPAPGIETIANLHRLLSFQLSSMGAANPEMIELATQCTKMVVEFSKLDAKKADRDLVERRVKVLEAKLNEVKEITNSPKLSAEEKAARMREVFGIGA